MARQIATVLNKNFRLMTQSTEDGFFAAAGDQLTEALLMLAKSTQYLDIMTAQALLGLRRQLARGGRSMSMCSGYRQFG
jgi:type IV secretory pathway TraG/TraD family ATPase VirD4